ncbi:MAG: translation elongation factor Ts [Gemmatimonadaceae bacterium 4484_173]|nr:MAG: translation elongation factor Ts [Gemmatimonadaceae bacterium 4484_173]RKZ03312.1 MAG: translation elongation factor Ts [Candidatus Fermentibacteria bacterium]
MAVDAKSVKELRNISGAGMMECKKALDKADGDIEAALKYLREQGVKVAAKRASRQANEGLVFSYIHGPGKLGVLVEINCETDFVARTDDFRNFCKLVAMHIAAAAPEYVSREEVPADKVEDEKQFLLKQLAESNKPENIKAKIVEGRMEKFYSEICLLDQEWIHDSETGKVADALSAIVAKIGENTVINRFARFQIGG